MWVAIASVLAGVLVGLALVGIMVDRSRHAAANPVIPSSCDPPPALGQTAGGESPAGASRNPSEVASAAANAMRTATADTFASPANIYVRAVSIGAHESGIDPALASHDRGLEQVTTGIVGTSPEMVYEIVNVEQFATVADAIAYNQRVFEVRCQQGEDPNTASSTRPGEFLIPQCGCTGSQGYAEMSLVVGDERIGIEDYLVQRTDQQVADLADEVLAAIDRTPTPVIPS